jgi:hydrogenase maturation protein HypF
MGDGIADVERRRIFVKGIVQGVGFRPFVFTLAQRLGLMGHVGNNSAGVFIEVEGDAQAIAQFMDELQHRPPPLAMIASVTSEAMPAQGDTAFVIVESEAQPASSTPISPDIALCDDCRRELFDPNDRRYRYPFINCTNCGPRFTIIKDIPYDRPFTTMAAFPMCDECSAEYYDPSNRRFHAQPIACPKCGPQVWFELTTHSQPLPTGEGSSVLPSLWEGSGVGLCAGDDAILAAQAALRAGAIIAVKGIGGFHLACAATNDDALRALRERKGRIDKPFAVMAHDVDEVRRFAEVSDDEAKLLLCKERPIVLLGATHPELVERRSASHLISPLVAPGNHTVGVMLPYTPLHDLLLAGIDFPLVMTSGNLSDEPICKDNDEARARLAALADGFLMHNRDIHVWCDDSVVRVFEGRELPLRRSRGYAPFPIRLTQPMPNTLAAGGELKSTFCLTRDDFAYLSQHIGDMENLETLHAFEKALDHFITLFRATPARIACDLHPGYLSTQWAKRYAGAHSLPLIEVQHHHAHIAGVLAEHGRDLSERAIGIAFDGTGYGADGAIWGGEVLIANALGFRRFAHLKYVPLPGGDSSIKRPYRTALAHLWAAGIAWDEALPCVAQTPSIERRVLRQQLEKNLNCAPTSSMGRLFDAVAALIGIRQTVTYEAQAAIEMEALCDEAVRDTYAFVLAGADPVVIDPAPMWREMVSDVKAGVPVATMAAKAHNAVAQLIVDLSVRAREETGLNLVAMSGGVFQNARLMALTAPKLRDAGFEVLTHTKVPPNDGGLSLGQAVIAGAQ